ncbi:hypothetical protein Ddye_014043 [Dipteronia dyeriana]|uniref:Protein kinase domain-containing protein n=1 Tax=Dipteronia dyeriana TaxID=168575 RepID=A0AAD9X7G7_9ROSI|nr:hypothetical protein Ddye_014043 [Dipteronia dyeriana]
MHGKRYFHKDLKPENLLISRGLIKIGDMGLAKEINSHQPLINCVMTRWYRAPEMVLCSENYSFKVDIWAMGAIMKLVRSNVENMQHFRQPNSEILARRTCFSGWFELSISTALGCEYILDDAISELECNKSDQVAVFMGSKQETKCFRGIDTSIFPCLLQHYSTISLCQ